MSDLLVCLLFGVAVIGALMYEFCSCSCFAEIDVGVVARASRFRVMRDFLCRSQQCVSLSISGWGIHHPAHCRNDEVENWTEQGGVGGGEQPGHDPKNSIVKASEVFGAKGERRRGPRDALAVSLGTLLRV